METFAKTITSIILALFLFNQASGQQTQTKLVSAWKYSATPTVTLYVVLARTEDGKYLFSSSCADFNNAKDLRAVKLEKMGEGKYKIPPKKDDPNGEYFIFTKAGEFFAFDDGGKLATSFTKVK